MRIGAEERARLGITDGVVRLSVGLEDAADLEQDLANALSAVRGQGSVIRGQESAVRGQESGVRTFAL
jgi:O-succinylhomoserine sulfhydrylase